MTSHITLVDFFAYPKLLGVVVSLSLLEQTIRANFIQKDHKILNSHILSRGLTRTNSTHSLHRYNTMIAKMISIPQMIIRNDDSPSTSSFKKCIYKKAPVVEEYSSSSTTTTKPQHEENEDLPRGIQVRRTVTFSKRVQAKKVRKLDKYTKEEKNAIWYTTEEYAAIKNRCIQTLKLMSADPNFEDCDEYSSRGLECRLKAASKCRKENRAFELNAVFEEQGRQALEYDDDSDAELIREVYLSVAGTSQQMAQFQGIRDRAAVEAMFDDESS